MKDSKATLETPPLTRAGRKVAEATLARAQFKTTSDGKRAFRQFEVHGMAVTEVITPTREIPTVNKGTDVAATQAAVRNPESMKSAPETAPLSRQGRKVADATLAAAKFKPTSDGKGAIRQFEVHGMVVTELVGADRTAEGTEKRK